MNTTKTTVRFARCSKFHFYKWRSANKAFGVFVRLEEGRALSYSFTLGDAISKLENLILQSSVSRRIKIFMYDRHFNSMQTLFIDAPILRNVYHDVLTKPNLEQYKFAFSCFSDFSNSVAQFARTNEEIEDALRKAQEEERVMDDYLNSGATVEVQEMGLW